MLSLTFALALSFAAQSARSQEASPHPDQVHFEKRTITVGKKTIQVEVAENPAQHEHGLMFRKSLPQDSGMLFVFKRPGVLTFWMKNTLIPLSIGYFDAKGKLIKVMEMKPAAPGDPSPMLYPSDQPALYALEMNPGWFKRNKIEPGTQLQIVK